MEWLWNVLGMPVLGVGEQRVIKKCKRILSVSVTAKSGELWVIAKNIRGEFNRG